jgi:hypothetical protein
MKSLKRFSSAAAAGEQKNSIIFKVPETMRGTVCGEGNCRDMKWMCMLAVVC